jgi:hypothetical protein
MPCLAHDARKSDALDVDIEIVRHLAAQIPAARQPTGRHTAGRLRRTTSIMDGNPIARKVMHFCTKTEASHC